MVGDYLSPILSGRVYFCGRVLVEDKLVRSSTIEQQPLCLSYADHEFSDELKQMSEILELLPSSVYDHVCRDISAGRSLTKGRKGVSGEQIVRILIVKQMAKLSYKKLEYALVDSNSYMAFCRIKIGQKIKSSTLQANIKLISPESLETLNRAMVEVAKREGIESGKKLRTDTTNVETNIHEPTDSSLLGDVNRVLNQLMITACDNFSVRFCSHARRAKKRAYEIQVGKKDPPRIDLYMDLMKVTNLTFEEAMRVSIELTQLAKSGTLGLLEEVKAEAIVGQIKHFSELGQRVMDQTRQRVIEQKKVPSKDKLVSIFETHTDILVKGKRKVEYGHKICISTGMSGLITDLQILDGNPNDATLTQDTVKRHIEIFGKAPRQAAFDGAFASRENLDKLKSLGVKDVAFNKSCGLEISDMTKSNWVYRSLGKFRASIEGTIGYLKSCFGLRRCMWRGLHSFQSYAWSAVLSANLLILARRRLASAS